MAYTLIDTNVCAIKIYHCSRGAAGFVLAWNMGECVVAEVQ